MAPVVRHERAILAGVRQALSGAARPTLQPTGCRGYRTHGGIGGAGLPQAWSGDLRRRFPAARHLDRYHRACPDVHAAALPQGRRHDLARIVVVRQEPASSDAPGVDRHAPARAARPDLGARSLPAVEGPAAAPDEPAEARQHRDLQVPHRQRGRSFAHRCTGFRCWCFVGELRAQVIHRQAPIDDTKYRADSAAHHIRAGRSAVGRGRAHSCPLRSARLAAAAVGASGDQTHPEYALDRDDGADGPGHRQRDGLGLAQQQEADRPRLPSHHAADRLHLRARLRSAARGHRGDRPACPDGGRGPVAGRLGHRAHRHPKRGEDQHEQ